MADKIYCDACAELREQDPSLIANGFSDSECTYMQNDQGLTGENDDCTDLNNLNDCLIGSMPDEAEISDICDWREYMKMFANNVWTLFKAIICAICGLWNNIHSIWNNIVQLQELTEKIDCIINYMLLSGATFTIGESTSGNAYAVAGKGVSFLKPGTTDHHADISLVYIAGGLLRGGGSYHFYNDDFTDSKAVGNFDNGSTYRVSQSRKGNSVWGQEGRPAKGGELICEFRIKKSAYPQIKTLFTGFGQETGGGAYHVQAYVFTEGNYAYGQHGWCDDDGSPSESGYSSGHTVPSGWIYVQLRLTYCFSMNASGSQYSPRYFMGIRMNENQIDC